MWSTHGDAERKFWRTPELLSKLMPLLDAPSASNLAEVHPFTVEVLQGGSTWKQLVETCCKSWESTRQEFEGTFEQKKMEVGHLVNILKKMENPEFYMLILLEIICQKTADGGSVHVEVICASHGSHKVSPLGFVLLEEVEGPFGTTEQEILTTETLYFGGILREPLLSALSSRIGRQGGKIENVFERTFTCTSQNEAEAFLTISQSCKKLQVGQLQVLGEIGEAGWGALAEGVGCRTWNIDMYKLHSVVAPREVMLTAKSEDLRTIWNCISGRGGHFLEQSLEGHWAMMVKKSVLKFKRHESETNWERQRDQEEWARLNQWIAGKCGCVESLRMEYEI